MENILYLTKSKLSKIKIGIIYTLFFTSFLVAKTSEQRKTFNEELSPVINREEMDPDNLTKNQIEEIITAIPELILKHYVFEDKGKRIAGEFKKLVNSGKYIKFHDPDSLINILSKDLEEISNDGHMYIKRKKQKAGSGSSEKSWEELEKENELKDNYGFESVRILDDNTAYIKITEFMHPKRTMPTAVAAMKLVENSQNLIIDLRNNGGGYPGIMLYILNHYFDGPPTHLSTTHFADRNSTPYTQYTSDLVYGELRDGSPLFLIVNEKTGSAAEYFAYTAQAFGIAKIIGERTNGAAHMNEYFELPHDFRISISTAAPVITKTNSNWELEGVIPNIETDPNISIEEIISIVQNNTLEQKK
ncbi:S41 family peptidase [Gramella sp. KN1008]|uniref:S41 family peptidase n=1 Tax=Gramella sp. KN1008 TaxID=2529298 RepID=UPI00103904A4|nr:S41 family peptidase [Gramella sp. KN1008]TBW25903.1 hypothetical protein EZJ28_14830 [Gramella sp. KN1008]